VRRPPEPPEDLSITLECEPTPKDWIVGRLADVTGNGTALPSPVDADLESELLARPADKGGSKLAVE
jgi:hypothetical protein